MRALIVCLFLIVGVSAQAAAPGAPANLDAWRQWVLKDQEFRACPLIAGTQANAAADFACIWPGTLEIAADAQGATLTQSWQVDIDAWVPLPGSHQHWPQQVSVDGKPSPVVDRNGPMLWMQAGRHQLRARLLWSERPQTVQVPVEIALVSLVVDGKPVAPLQRAGNQLTLGRGKALAIEADSIDLRVFRKFRDEIPGELTTQIRINASGQAREESFGPVLPEGFVPLALVSQQWPARLDDQGSLHVQVQPGSNTVTLTARASVPVDKLVARFPESNWAAQEIWSYESVPSLRVTSISGAIQVDPRQADVPGAWSNLPAFALNNGENLTIEQRSRGLDADVANRLELRREAWLDFSGDGWFARDRISGQMLNGWRFDVAEPFELQRAQAGSDSDDALLVTRGAEAGMSGVEWRNSRVDLNAGVRIDATQGRMPISGWSQAFDQVSTTLHLPYGYRLIAAPGSDRASGSWMSRWSLLDVFLAAIIVLVASRLLGWIGGALTTVFLLLGYQESGSPLWTLLAVIVLALVARLLPKGRLSSVAGALRTGAVVLLLLVALPFAAGQLRQALYPQLEPSYAGYGQADGFSSIDYASNNEPMQDAPADYAQEMEALPAPMPAAAPPPPPRPEESAGAMRSRMEVQKSSVPPHYREQKLSKRYSQSTVVQTGGGEPGWQLGTRYQLGWSGPVLPDQEVRLLIAPPWLVRLLRVIMVMVLAALLWRLLRDVRLRWNPVASKAAQASLIFLCLSLATVPAAQAQEFPPEELLEQLKARLVEPPQCAPQCANIANAQVAASDDGLQVVLEIHALDHVAVPMPDDAGSIAIRSIRVDGVARDAVVSRNGHSWIALDRGVHRVELDSTILGDRIELAFPMAPERIAFTAEGWLASGIADDRLLTETLNLARAREDSGQGASTAEQRFPPYVRVYRTLNLDLEWTVATLVERLAPREGGFTIGLPTLAGEHVSTPGLKVRDGEVTIGLADSEGQTGWNSTLDQSDSLRLTAPALDGHAEVWRILAGPTWHLELGGVPESASSTDSSGEFHIFEFHPLPGESLDLKISKPVAVEGATRAIDSLNLASEFGVRASNHTLQFVLRASQGGEQAISLPSAAELLGVTRDGETIGARVLDGKLSLPVNPGTQNYSVRFRDDAELGAWTRTPEVSLGLPAANINLAINLPADRWLLAAFGPPAGPAILFWGELLVAIVLALLLARWRKGPLRIHQWLLLVLGFSTFSWIALLIVVGWLFALDWRERYQTEVNWKFNLVQIGLAFWTLIALLWLFESIRNGLLGSPDMVVRGNGSYASQLQWFSDRSIDALPTASVLSLPLWFYNIVMLVWALWLAWALVGWLRSGFAAWMRDGYWRPWRVAAPEPAIDLPPQPPPAA
ncbi:hypothetical protein [Dokdonella sp.]|uniref:hypothetical protein n=1 Tax=Dokdonella sp. TaxID=2291710 RepID=UPI003528BACC